MNDKINITKIDCSQLTHEDVDEIIRVLGLDTEEDTHGQ